MFTWLCDYIIWWLDLDLTGIESKLDLLSLTLLDETYKTQYVGLLYNLIIPILTHQKIIDTTQI